MIDKTDMIVKFCLLQHELGSTRQFLTINFIKLTLGLVNCTKNQSMILTILIFVDRNFAVVRWFQVYRCDSIVGASIISDFVVIQWHLFYLMET